MTLKPLTHLLAVACVGSAYVTADAQRIRNHGSQEVFRIPGTGARMYPPPRQIIRVNGATIYVGQNSHYWPYGTSVHYSWPYGYPSGYSWPYGRSYYGHRRSRWRN